MPHTILTRLAKLYNDLKPEEHGLLPFPDKQDLMQRRYTVDELMAEVVVYGSDHPYSEADAKFILRLGRTLERDGISGTDYVEDKWNPQAVGYAVTADADPNNILIPTVGTTHRMAAVNWLVTYRGVRITNDTPDALIEDMFKRELRKSGCKLVKVPISCKEEVKV